MPRPTVFVSVKAGFLTAFNENGVRYASRISLSQSKPDFSRLSIQLCYGCDLCPHEIGLSQSRISHGFQFVKNRYPKTTNKVSVKAGFLTAFNFYHEKFERFFSFRLSQSRISHGFQYRDLPNRETRDIVSVKAGFLTAFNWLLFI